MPILTVTNEAASGAGSFADAVAGAEATAGADTITFAVGIDRIATSGTTTLSNQITIDGDLNNDSVTDATLTADQSADRGGLLRDLIRIFRIPGVSCPRLSRYSFGDTGWRL